MLDFQRELLNRFLVAAAIAKADGFEATANAMLAVAEDMYNDFVAHTLGDNICSFGTLRSSSCAIPQQTVPH
jgi:hypothetical protein